MKNQKIVWFSAFRNVVPADYEAWLEEMAAQGWQVDSIGQWSSVFMTLTRAEPKQVRFVYDMQLAPKKEYRMMYEQFGWEFIGQMASAFIWRKEYSQIRPESFSDADSVENRNKRVMAAASVSFIMFSLIAIMTTVFFLLNFGHLVTGDILQFILGMILSYAIAISMGFVIKKIHRNSQR